MKTILLFLFFAFLGQANAQSFTSCLGTPSCFSDPQLSHTSWAWDFGDGNIACCTDPSPCHTYSIAGTYTVTLFASDNNGNKDTVLQSILIDFPPVANFSSSSGSNGITFTDLSTSAGAAVVAWYWSFPGGSPNTSSVQNPPSVTYPAGAYSACLVVTTSNGCKDTSCHAVTIASVNENYINNIVSIFPNPFSTRTALKMGLPLNDATLVVYNSFGQQVKQLKNISGQLITLYRDNLPGGLYFMCLEQDNNIVTTGRLIITDN